MYFTRASVLAVVAFFSTSSLACQCYINGSPDAGLTESCCVQNSGVVDFPGQCQAASISESLSEFRSCCGGDSDCDFPAKREQPFQA